MKRFSCIHCNYSTSVSSNYKKHLTTKKHDRNKKGTLKTKGDLGLVSQQKPTLSHEEPKKRTNEPETKKFQCDYCDAVFSTKPNKRRHELHRCKYNKSLKSDIIKTQEEKIKKLEHEKIVIKFCMEKEKKELKREMKLEMEKQRRELMSQIELLLTKVGNTTINTTNNHIKINSYGSEDLSHITTNMKTDYLKIPYGAIPKMIKDIHFNIEKPENTNIKITNKKEKFIKVFENGKWNYKNKKDTIEDLIDDKYNIIDSHYEECSDELKEKEMERYEDFRNKYDDNDNELISSLNETAELCIINNSV